MNHYNSVPNELRRTPEVISGDTLVIRVIDQPLMIKAFDAIRVMAACIISGI
jgi:hypothetical protein